MKLVAMTHRLCQNARQKSDGIHNEHITLPPPYRVSCPAGFDIGGMLREVHVDRSLKPELTILKNNGVLTLSNAVNRAVKRPVKDDAGRFATESRIVLARETGGFLLSKFRQFGSPVELRPGAASAPCTSPCS